MKRLCKCLLAMLLLAAIALPMGGCSFSDLLDSSSDHTTEQQGNQGNNQGNQQDDKEKEPDLSKYSDILKTVLTSNYYNNIADRVEGPHVLNLPDEQAYPFGFLRNQGYNINDYINRKLEIVGDVYIKGNDTSHLYIATRVESEHEQGNYYTCYILKYDLTPQEYNDLVMLHEGQYIQAPLFIQELSYEKEPTIVNDAKISKQFYDFEKNMPTDPSLKGKNFELDFLGYDTPNGSRKFNIHFAVRVRNSNKNSMISDNSMILDNNYIRYLTIQTLNSAGDLSTYGNNIFNGPTAGNIINLEEYQNKPETMTYFEADSYSVNNSKPWLYKQ